MVTKTDLQEWVLTALADRGGRARIVSVAEWIWTHKEQELKGAGELFFTWQYDMRWAATELRKSKQIKDKDLTPKGIWELA
ncbi:hypothetical protein OB959_22935 [Aeromonas bestiarum]|uniref:Restriction system protein Mrr-like N-terminal domain-containing protein n=1 Tax=Aeromonas bestiarum TaxID=105751 RepID=A0AAW7I752_9GAMM|nr:MULTISPECIES: hypothetical protein [Aeromonas]ATL97914.1 hypothetical protein CK910_04965 [Aeromonas sp. CA23]MDM5142610.1 hypothetical protein [Aeromonas bestiarum]